MTDPIQTEASPPEAAPPQVASLAPPPPRIVRRGGTPVLLTLLLFALLAGAVGYMYTNPRPQGAGDQALDALTRQVQAQSDAQNTLSAQFQSASQTIGEQIKAMDSRLDKLEQAPAPAATPAAAPSASADTSDLTRRLDELTAKVETLAARPAPEASAPAQPAPAQPAPAPASPSAPSEQQVADLAAKLDQLQASQKTGLDQQAAQDKQALDAANARIEKLEQGAGKVESEADRAARLALVQQANAALQAGTPLGNLPGAPPALARFATTAPPTEAVLRNSFANVADQARAASRPEQTKTTLLERAWSRVEQSVTVRRGDQVIIGDPAAGVLARAQDDVANGDLAGAVRALAALQGPAAAAVQPWVEKTRSLLDARAALAGLAAHP